MMMMRTVSRPRVTGLRGGRGGDGGVPWPGSDAGCPNDVSVFGE
ncbi:hypothetical protein [Azospirillum sp. INR13]|nr:hypothetical protein [Azospirillum sp. INR13]